MQENKQEKSRIKQNILLYLQKKGISEYRFYKESGMTRGILQQPNGISEDNIARFLDYANDINISWLLTSAGDMLNTSLVSEDTEDNKYPIANKAHCPTEVTGEHPYLPETRPRIPFDAAAGALSIAIQGVIPQECEQIPIIPTFPTYDFSIIARGDSMYPDIHSGDELACALVQQQYYILWGRTYVLDTAQGIVVKRVFEDKNQIICRSINPDYPDFCVPKDEIYHMALVVGLIRHF